MPEPRAEQIIQALVRQFRFGAPELAYINKGQVRLLGDALARLAEAEALLQEIGGEDFRGPEPGYRKKARDFLAAGDSDA